MPSATHASPRPIARALRAAAVTWMIAAIAEAGLEFGRRQAFERIDAGAEFAEVADRIATLSWISAALTVASMLAVIASAGAWARVGRLGSIARLGQIALGAATLAHVLFLVMRLEDVDTAALERLMWAQRFVAVGFHLGLAAIVAGSRAPMWSRTIYAALAVGWLAFVLGDRSELGAWTASIVRWIPLTMASVWALALWLAAPAYADVEPTAERARVDDPVRLRAAAGLSLLRAGLLGRVGVVVLSAIALVLLRNAPHSAGAVVWLLALAQCGLAVVIGTALTRYSCLPDVAIERGHVNTALACLAIGAVLELAGASMTAELLGYATRAQSMTFAGMPSLAELERLQSRVQWIGRGGSVVGIVGAVSLSLTLRKTALWLDDAPSVARASTLGVASILGGGAAVVLVGLAQSGAVRELWMLAALALGALGLAVAVLTAWLRLLSATTTALRSEAPDRDRPPWADVELTAR